MFSVVSPRASNYLHTATPAEGVAQLSSAQPRVMQPWEKVYETARILSYFLGSALFLVGSVAFYPKYSVMWDGQGGVFGSWCFVVGCIFFFICSNLDFINTVRFNKGGILRRTLRAYTELCNYIAASIFILGALYFLPTWYPKSPELGCWAFIIGSILFCLGALSEIGFICMTHEDPRITGVRVKNIFCWGTVSATGTFIGALLFTIGSYYYLPKYIAVADATEAEDNMYYAINYYTIGSVFFVISALGLVPDAIVAFRAGHERSTSKMCAADTKV